MSQLVISKEYEELVFPLDKEDYDNLFRSIKESGLWYPIIVNREGIVLDGHHRFKICEKLGIEPRIEVKYFDDKNDEALFVIDSNKNRRHLDTAQRTELSFRKEPYIKAKAHGKQLSGLKQYINDSRLDTSDQTDSTDVDHFWTDEQIAKDANVGITTVKQYRKAKKKNKHTDILSGKKSIKEAYKEIQNDERKKQLEEKAQERRKEIGNVTKSYELIPGDFNKILDSKTYSEKFDIILTDPPYGKDYLYLYEQLADHADLILKSGGSLLVMTGQSHLPEIYRIFAKNENLNYRWTLAYETPGTSTQIHDRKIRSNWKPILVYTKDEYNSGMVQDVIISQKPEKSDHEWQQSESGMEALIKNYTNELDLILDPFAGSGTTGVVAIKNNRRFIGIDIDQKALKTAEDRLTLAQQKQ